MNKSIETTIKEETKVYKKYYPYVFKIAISDTIEFRSFMYASKKEVIEVLHSFNIENPNQVFLLLFENDEKKVFGNTPTFFLLKQLFYIALILAITKKSELKGAEELIDSMDDVKRYKEFLKDAKGNKWFRGQNSFEWDLIPSFFRKIKTNSVFQIDTNTIWNDYYNFGLIDKAYKTIGYSGVNYNFISFMQHAVAFSPLIDFTSNPIVAAVMGLSDTADFREHYNNDSALFKLKINPETVISDRGRIDNIIKNYRVYYAKTFPFGANVYLHGKNITINNISSLIDALAPQYALIDIPTNDRMRYQSGKFILFYDCLIVGMKIYIELANGLQLTRYKVDKRFKQKGANGETFLESLLKEYPEFSFTNMMNPYEWFGR